MVSELRSTLLILLSVSGLQTDESGWNSETLL